MAVSLCDQVRIDPILEVQVCKFKYNFKARAARGSSEELEKNAGPVHILCIPVFGTPKKLQIFFYKQLHWYRGNVSKSGNVWVAEVGTVDEFRCPMNGGAEM